MLSKQCKAFLKAMENSGLQGGKGDNNAVRQSQHIHDPGSQPEPAAEPCGTLLLPRVSSGTQQKCGTPRAQYALFVLPVSHRAGRGFSEQTRWSVGKVLSRSRARQHGPATQTVACGGWWLTALRGRQQECCVK